MKLDLRHTFACDPDTYWKAYWDPELEARVQHDQIDRTVLSDTTEDGVRTTRTRVVAGGDMPGVVKKALGGNALTYEQISRYDIEGGTLSWEVVPAVMADKVTARGEVTVREVPGGTERISAGVIEVKVPFLGGKIEQIIHDAIAKGHDETTAELAKLIADKYV